MSVDITDMVDNLIAEVNVPGGDAFPGATTTEWETRLLNAFWETVIDGITMNYTMDGDGIITPVTGTTEFTREYQQIVVFYAGISVVRNALRTIGSLFRAKAGPVEYETQNAATVLKGILDELVKQRNIILARLSDLGASNSVYIDAVLARQESLAYRDTTWVGYESRSPAGGPWGYGNGFGMSGDW